MLKKELTEKKPLPIGRMEFEEWSDRIIAGAMLPADAESQKFALANDLMHCSPNTAFEADIYFIHRLRKYAVNQVADAIRTEIRNARKAQQEPVDVTTSPPKADAEILQGQVVS
jgi:hypothetical protein